MQPLSALLIASLVAVSLAANAKPREYYEKLFFEHVQNFNLKFSHGKEFADRLSIFAGNVDIIEAHNSDSTQTFKMGFNQFTHLSYQEFLDTVKIGGTRVPNLRRNPGGKLHKAPTDSSTLTTSVDWTTKGAVTPVKNQGSCGSCWSFSATGSLEGAYYLKYGTLLSFSEQQLVSCDTTDLGCNGGWMDDAFTWITNNGGITTEDQYPYSSGGGTTGTCVSSGYTNVKEAAPVSFTDVTPEDVAALQSAVAQQPVSIAIQANQLAFQLYSSGVLTGRCGTNLDHGVLAVGYGTDANTSLNYWKVKNSWGTSWGESGFIRILADSSNLCGVLSAPSYPNL